MQSNALPAVSLLDLKQQYQAIREEVHQAMDRVVASQHFILGPEVEGLEAEVAAYSQAKFGIGVSSGSDALIIALMAVGLQPGDEVITSPYTFFATGGAIARLGGRPVFVDIDPVTFNLDPAKIAAAVTAKTKAIIPVHLYGQMADMDPIMAVAQTHRLAVIEDAAQAIGSEYKGRRAGSIGQLGCFSFFPSKNLGGFGDGGMVTTSDAALAHQLKLLRNHGAEPKYYHKIIGGNFRLDALQAAVLRVKLKYLDQWHAARQRNAATYRRLFAEAGLVLAVEPGSSMKGQAGVSLPPDAGYGRHIYNQFCIRCDRRSELMQALKDRQVSTEIYYPVSLHQQECFRSLGYQTGDFPQSERAAEQSLALPIYPELTEAMLEAVVAGIGAFYRGKA